MLTNQKNPVEYALLLYELDDAREHLIDLITLLRHSEGDNEGHLRARLAEVCEHLNRAWNARNHVGEITSEQFVQHSRFPNDLLLA